MPRRYAECALGRLRLLNQVLRMRFRKSRKVVMAGPCLNFRTEMA